MSIIFDLAEAINIGIGSIAGVAAGEAFSPLIDMVNNRVHQKRLVDALVLAIKSDPDLSDDDKYELTYFFEKDQFITTFLEAAAEAVSPQTRSNVWKRKDENRRIVDQRWESVMSNLGEVTQAKVWERLLFAAINAIVDTLPLKEQILHHKLNYITMRLNQLQKGDQQDEAHQAALDELKRIGQRFDNFSTLLEPFLKEAVAQSEGSVIVDHQVDEYLNDTVAPLIQDVGEERKEEIKQIKNFIWDRTANCDQWWWWKAEAWSGKTTLMAYLAANLEPEVNIAAVFIMGLEEANRDSTAFYFNLIPQLAKIAGLSRIEIPSDIQGRRVQFKRLINVAAAKTEQSNGRLVILVDGLDEDQGPYPINEAVKQSVMASLPKSLPANVRVIVSSRSNLPLPTDLPDNHPLRNSKYIHLLAKSERAEHIEIRATDELDKILKLKDAQGVRYGRDMLAFMAASGGWLTSRDLAKLTGQDYYSINEILNKGATARSFKSRLLTDGKRTYFIGHKRLDELLICEHLEEEVRCPPQDSARYKLERFLALRKWRHKIVAWAESYSQKGWLDTTPEYLCSDAYTNLLFNDTDLEEHALAVLTNLSRTHFLRSKHGNDYISLMQLRAYIDILVERITTIPSASLTHLAIALHFFSLLSQRTHYIPAGLPAVFVLLGKSEYAVTLALSIIDPLAKADALSQIAIAHAKSGNSSKARDIAELAFKITNGITNLKNLENCTTSQVLTNIALVFSESTNAIKATNITIFALIALIPSFILDFDQTTFDQTSRQIFANAANVAIALAKSGNITDTISIGLIIQNVNPGNQIFSDIVTALAKSGNTIEATKIANAVTDPDSVNQIIANIVTIIAEFDNPLAVGFINRRINYFLDPYNKARILSDIATALAKSGNTVEAVNIAERAVKIANSFSDPDDKARILSNIATALAKFGKTIEAINLAKRIVRIANSFSDPDDKARILVKIVTALAKSGNTVEAINLANSICDPHIKDKALTNLATTLAESGDVVEAIEIVNIITNPYSITKVLTAAVDVAIELTETDNATKATNISELLLRTANTITDKYKEIEILTTVATALARSGYSTTAIDIANAIPFHPYDKYTKTKALANIATELTKSGNTADALDIANTFTNPYFKTAVLADVAASLAESGNTSEATNIARLAYKTMDVIPKLNAEKTAQIFTKIAVALIKSGNSSEALDMANIFTNPYFKTKILADVAASLAESGNTSEATNIARLALETTNTIKDLSRKAFALADVAVAYMESGNFTDAANIVQLAFKTENSIIKSRSSSRKIFNIRKIILTLADSKKITAKIAELILNNIEGIPGITLERALAKIAITLAKSGNTSKALSIANILSASDDKVRILTTTATILVKSRNIPKATYITELALRIANKVNYNLGKAHSLVDVAAAFAKSGNIDKAINTTELLLKSTVNSIDNPVFRAKVLGRLAIEFSMPKMANLQVKAIVAMLMSTKNPWICFDILLYVDNSSALAILPFLQVNKQTILYHDEQS